MGEIYGQGCLVSCDDEEVRRLAYQVLSTAHGANNDWAAVAPEMANDFLDMQPAKSAEAGPPKVAALRAFNAIPSIQIMHVLSMMVAGLKACLCFDESIAVRRAALESCGLLLLDQLTLDEAAGADCAAVVAELWWAKLPCSGVLGSQLSPSLHPRQDAGSRAALRSLPVR
jgi:hypothetical protein